MSRGNLQLASSSCVPVLHFDTWHSCCEDAAAFCPTGRLVAVMSQAASGTLQVCKAHDGSVNFGLTGQGSPSECQVCFNTSGDQLRLIQWGKVTAITFGLDMTCRSQAFCNAVVSACRSMPEALSWY